MNESPDDALEKSFVESPKTHFRHVYDRYSGPLYRYLYRFTGNNQASEEILHDIFVELFGGRFKTVPGGTLKSWLFTVARNRGLNYQKKQSKVIDTDTRDLRCLTNLEEQTISLDLHRRLSEAEDMLPVDIRETWTLRKSGLDNKQIAAILAIPLGTVKSRFSRLVEYLRKEFET
ncbi:MAG: hypothetical protein COT74_10755 [Bdellovibrionales bacterium CG10_big_fil_rev_8_21_14_0_10_45_34]|nr:MAG: hypothetical protein COT74_10755 [Bdellovibrionales bacterium CG10_big_fil_rev_8_21_14_0_10_45_34]